MKEEDYLNGMFEGYLDSTNIYINKHLIMINKKNSNNHYHRLSIAIVVNSFTV